MSSIKIRKTELANGETLAYRERMGGEQELLLIHGNMTSSKHWDVLIEAMSDSYHIIAVDLRGYGLSSYHHPIETIKDFSDDVKLLVDCLGLKTFHLMGWSLGGGAAMQFAADHPECVNKLVLLASASTRGYPFYGLDDEGKPVKRLETIEDIRKDTLKTIPVQQAYDTKNKDFLRQVWDMTIYTHNKPNEKQYDEYLNDMLTQRNLAESYYVLNIYNISEKDNGLGTGTAEVKRIQAPTLVLWGENDLVVSKSMIEEIEEDFEGRAKIEYLKNCGHSPLVDDLDQLIQKLERFLKEDCS